jgi:hypothetical protein
VLVGLASAVVGFVGPRPGAAEAASLLRAAGFLAHGLSLAGLLLCSLTHGIGRLRAFSWVTAGAVCVSAGAHDVLTGAMLWHLPPGAVAVPPSVLADFLPWMLLVILLGVAAFASVCVHLRALAAAAGDRALAGRFLAFHFGAPLGSLAVPFCLALVAALLTGSAALSLLAGMVGGVLSALGTVLWLLSLLLDLRELMKPVGE